MSKRITPFSKLTDFMSWQSNNCDKCCRYSNVSSKRQNAKCKLAFDLDYACVSDGTISTDTALKIGCTEYNGIDGSCTLGKCKDFDKPIIRKKYPKKIKGQINLFEND